MGKKFEVVNDDISDGYHTFDELYAHRVGLYLCLARASGWPAYYKFDYDAWFCLYLETPEGQISYHLPGAYFELVKDFAEPCNSPCSEFYGFDGHDSNEVYKRLIRLSEKERE